MLGLGSSISIDPLVITDYSIKFDGTGDYFDTGTALQSTMDGSFSCGGWIKPDDGVPANHESLFGAGNTGDQDEIIVELTGRDGYLKISQRSNNDPSYLTTDIAPFPDGPTDWAHVMFTSTKNSGSDTTHVIYVNGSAVASTASGALSESNHELYTSSDNFFIGGFNNAGSVALPYSGRIAEWAVWNSALDASTAAAVYNSGKRLDLSVNSGSYGAAPGLVLYYKFNNNTKDETGNSNGTLAANAMFDYDVP